MYKEENLGNKVKWLGLSHQTTYFFTQSVTDLN